MKKFQSSLIFYQHFSKLRIYNNFEDMFKVCIFVDIACCTIALCVVMLIVQVEIIVEYSTLISIVGVLLSLIADFIIYFHSIFAVKRYNWSRRIRENECVIPLCICFSFRIVRNWTTTNEHIWRNRIWIRTIGLVFISNWSTATTADSFDWRTGSHCFWVLWNPQH